MDGIVSGNVIKVVVVHNGSGFGRPTVLEGEDITVKHHADGDLSIGGFKVDEGLGAVCFVKGYWQSVAVVVRPGVT